MKWGEESQLKHLKQLAQVSACMGKVCSEGKALMEIHYSWNTNRQLVVVTALDTSNKINEGFHRNQKDVGIAVANKEQKRVWI